MRIRRRPSGRVCLRPADTDSTDDAAEESDKPNPISTALSRLVTVEEGATELWLHSAVWPRVYGAWKEGSVDFVVHGSELLTAASDGGPGHHRDIWDFNPPS